VTRACSPARHGIGCSSCKEVYVRTRQHPTVQGFPANLARTFFDDLYEQSERFEDVYEKLLCACWSWVSDQKESPMPCRVTRSWQKPPARKLPAAPADGYSGARDRGIELFRDHLHRPGVDPFPQMIAGRCAGTGELAHPIRSHPTSPHWWRRSIRERLLRR
jgi:hypothetical protein